MRNTRRVPRRRPKAAVKYAQQIPTGSQFASHEFSLGRVARILRNLAAGDILGFASPRLSQLLARRRAQVANGFDLLAQRIYVCLEAAVPCGARLRELRGGGIEMR